jgi:D-alanine-D-alanine ligase
VGDVVRDRASAIATRSFDADKPTLQDIEQITSWLRKAGYTVEVEDSVTRFTSDPPRGRPDILVLPLWRGGRSRNRTAIVPAICEELAIPYVGGDVFVHTVCQDKSLSKVFLRDAGYRVPAEWYLPTRADIGTFAPSSRLARPFVIKPQYSAASIGIDDGAL